MSLILQQLLLFAVLIALVTLLAVWAGRQPRAPKPLEWTIEGPPITSSVLYNIACELADEAGRMDRGLVEVVPGSGILYDRDYINISIRFKRIPPPVPLDSGA